MATGTEITKVGINSGESSLIAVAIKEAGVPIIPDSVTWSLMNGSYQIVNARQDVPVTPGNPTVITLTPADTIANGADELRYLTVRAVYTSRVLLGEDEVIQDGLGENIDDVSGETITAGIVASQCIAVRQWRFPVKYLKEAVL